MLSLVARARTYASLVSLSHTVFALPFAGAAVVLAHAVPHAPLTAPRLLAMLVCMVSARTSAMAFNRWADRDVDAKNPRTRARHIPAGTVRPFEALALSLVSGAVFLAAAATLGRWPAVGAPLVLAVLLGYSRSKRFTWASHLWLGIALALAPGGAWLAMGAPPGPGILTLMIAVATWLLGFDILYSLQDETFDREHGLHSIPARFGVQKALLASAAAHVVTVAALATTGLLLHRGLCFALGVGVTGLLLAYEHSLLSPRDLSKIDRAFFDVNAWVSMGFFMLTLADAILR